MHFESDIKILKISNHILILLLFQWRHSIFSSIPTAKSCWKKWNRIWGGSWCK